MKIPVIDGTIQVLMYTEEEYTDVIYETLKRIIDNRINLDNPTNVTLVEREYTYKKLANILEELAKSYQEGNTSKLDLRNIVTAISKYMEHISNCRIVSIKDINK